MLVPLPSVEAVEVYRRPAEVPVEYGVTQSSSDPGSFGGTCGVLVFWTKQGLGAGQVPAFGSSRVGSAEVGASPDPTLPLVEAQGPPPTPGERIRMQLGLEARTASSLGSPWSVVCRRP